uniref:Proteasome component Ecm29 N-terminal domain-containing protein n=1 Tax=Peronospora matthiolae TaxID=2874970 RepID=A0AAV1TDW4_9STRA
MAESSKDVEALDRVLFRLASVDDERMLQVLQSLLPQLLVLYPRSVSTSLEQQLKEKVLRAVSHIKTRLDALHRPALPLDALCQVLQQSALSVVSHNLAFLFLEMGFDAASTELQTRVLAAVVQIVSRLSVSQQETFCRLLVRALPVTASVVFPRTEGAARDQREVEMTLNSDVIDHVNEGNDANINVVLDFILDLVLYEPPSSTRTNATTTFGLMTPRLERLQRVKIPQFDREVLYKVQLDALRLVKEMTIPTRCKIPVYLAGSASFHHAVKDFSNEQLSRVVKLEETELEDADVARRLMALVLGSQVAQCAGASERGKCDHAGRPDAPGRCKYFASAVSAFGFDRSHKCATPDAAIVVPLDVRHRAVTASRNGKQDQASECAAMPVDISPLSFILT